MPLEILTSNLFNAIMPWIIDGRSVLDKFYKLVLVTDPLDHYGMNKICTFKNNYSYILKLKTNLENCELLRPWGPQSQLPQSQLPNPLHDTNLSTLSTQTPRGQELLGHIKKEWQIKLMAVFFVIAHEKGFKFHAQPQTGAYSC